MWRSGPHHLSPPFAALVDGETFEQRRRECGAVGDTAGEVRRLGAAPEFAHAGVDAVGRDNGVGLGVRSVGKADRHAAGTPVEIDELLVERDASIGHAGRQRVVQVAAVHEQVGRAVFRLGVGAERQFVGESAGVPVAVGPGARLERSRPDARLKPDPAQHAHGVWAHLDAGAEPNEAGRLLVDLGLDAAPMQRRGEREPAHSGADDCKRRCHDARMRWAGRGVYRLRRMGTRPACIGRRDHALRDLDRWPSGLRHRS